MIQIQSKFMESIKQIYRIGHGPSSSHTMGPMRAAQMFLDRNKEAARFNVTLYGSLAATGKGHMTDAAILEVLRPVAETTIVWEPKMKDNPPLRARAMANPESDTDCIIAETKGIFSSIADFSPFLNFTKGVFNETLAGMHCFVVKPGIRRYSPNVLETFSQRFGSFYILPSSLHEALLVPTCNGFEGDMLDMVKTVNATEVSPEDFLADSVYFYDSKTNQIQM